MKMKKMLAALLAGTMLVGLLAACGDKGTTESQKPGNESQNPVDRRRYLRGVRQGCPVYVRCRRRGAGHRPAVRL